MPSRVGAVHAVRQHGHREPAHRQRRPDGRRRRCRRRRRTRPSNRCPPGPPRGPRRRARRTQWTPGTRPPQRIDRSRPAGRGRRGPRAPAAVRASGSSRLRRPLVVTRDHEPSPDRRCARSDLARGSAEPEPRQPPLRSVRRIGRPDAVEGLPWRRAARRGRAALIAGIRQAQKHGAGEPLLEGDGHAAPRTVPVRSVRRTARPRSWAARGPPGRRPSRPRAGPGRCLARTARPPLGGGPGGTPAAAEAAPADRAPGRRH